MNAVAAAKIRNNPHFQELVAKRSRLGWILSAIMLGLYYAFILVIAFAPHALAVPVAQGSVITVGIPIGIALILVSFALTGIYVHKANTEFDRLTQAIRDGAAHDGAFVGRAAVRGGV